MTLRAHVAQAGLVPQGDTIRERASRQSTAASIEPIIVSERIQMHALGLLTGAGPEAYIAELTHAPTIESPPPPVVSPGLPSELLRRRPDIRAAERRLAASTADIGVAVADLYPKFSLTGMAQLISSALGNLFSSDSLQTTANASAMFPVLDFGRRKNEVTNRREQREQAYIDYQRTVVGALKDVEDALARVSGEQRRLVLVRQGIADAVRSRQAVEARYRTGLVDLSAVLQAQQSVLQQQSTLAESEGTLKQALASLYKALGGGWDEQTIERIEAQRVTKVG